MRWEQHYLYPPPNHILAYTQFSGFWKWMYPDGGGDEQFVSDAALGVIILWFCWCGKRGGGLGEGHGEERR